MSARRSLVPFFLALLVLACGLWSLKRLRLQTELFPLFPQRLASVQGLEVSEKLFAANREVVVVARRSTPDQREWLNQAAEKLRRDPEVESVAPLEAALPVDPAEISAWMLAQLPPERFAQFQHALEPAELRKRLEETWNDLGGLADPADLARAKADPFRLSEFIPGGEGIFGGAPSKRGPALVGLRVRAARSLDRFEDCEGFVKEVRSIVGYPKTADELPSFHLVLTGRPVFVAENAQRMRRDMILMIAVATALVALFFWLFYRSFLPLLLILGVQALAALAAAIVAGAAFGELNVLSIGFASIILGVGMDYCILVYHHFSLHRGDQDSHWGTLRHGIHLSAVTTAASFLILAFSSFPGFRQLAVLVAAGLLATGYFATELLPVFLRRFRSEQPRWIGRWSERFGRWIQNHDRALVRVWGTLAILGVALFPVYKSYSFYSGDVRRLQPVESEAMEGQKLLMKARPGTAEAALIVSAESWDALRVKVGSIQADIPAPLPMGALLPAPGSQKANQQAWMDHGAALDAALKGSPVPPAWTALTRRVLDRLDRWKAGADFKDARAFLAGFTAERGGRYYIALPWREPSNTADWTPIRERIGGALPVSWNLLKFDLSATAQADFGRLSLAMIAILAALCWMAHRSLRLVALNALTLATSFALFLALLWLTGNTMTLLSLLAIPLLLGLVVDISLHLILGMEEEHGELPATYIHLAGPVTLTGITSMIGFGAPMLASQPALQNLGLTMDLGILSAVATGLIFLPAFYRRTASSSHSRGLYRSFWFERAANWSDRLGLDRSRAIGKCLGAVYAATHRGKRRRLRDNLRLLANGPIKTRPVRVFQNFGETLADYFWMGARDPEDAFRTLIADFEGYPFLEQAHREGRGCIIATAHFGLFELGGLLMSHFKFPSVALTLPEPTPELSAWRAEFRKRWGTRTLEIGRDATSYLKVVQELRSGSFIAVLVDRPHGGRSIEVDFGHGPLPFSTGPAWLALLAGAPIIPSTIFRGSDGRYRLEAHALVRPPADSRATEETAAEMTREIARALQKVLCQYPEQWYQFGSLQA
ncbi:MAG: MMPL family transporter [Verrucomicrobiae bacterium]|nr:MMPL family transporter [Verrucomicrobiae bacterium]